MQRRDFLQMMALAAPALTVSGRLFAAPPGSPRFLLVFLRGGYDCAGFGCGAVSAGLGDREVPVRLNAAWLSAGLGAKSLISQISQPHLAACQRFRWSVADFRL